MNTFNKKSCFFRVDSPDCVVRHAFVISRIRLLGVFDLQCAYNIEAKKQINIVLINKEKLFKSLFSSKIRETKIWWDMREWEICFFL